MESIKVNYKTVQVICQLLIYCSRLKGIEHGGCNLEELSEHYGKDSIINNFNK